MAIIDVPNGDRLYLLCPVVAGVYQPAILVTAGLIRPSYVVPDLLGVGCTYSEGSQKAVNARRETKSIQMALRLMTTVWGGILDVHPGSRDNVKQQERLAEDLRRSPEAAYALIEKSKMLGSEGVPKKPEDYVRNVYALAYWKGIIRIRKADFRGQAKGLAWSAAARALNDVCHRAIPDWEEWRWRDFNGKSLEKFANHVGLSASLNP